MNTITDVLQLLLRLAPVREESVLTEALGILESGREKLDAFVHGVEHKGEQAVQAVEQASAPQSPVTLQNTTGSTPTVAGL